MKSETPSSRILGRSLEAAGHTRPPGSAAHHIVAGGADDAEPARRVLANFGIGINDAANGVFLPASKNSPNVMGAAVHASLHTKRYYKAVNKLLSTAKTRERVLAILAGIRQKLLAGGL
jgi:cyanophycinase-like exopeptidase